MKLNIPFIYEALIVKPGCRKPSILVLRDFVEVDVREVSADALPVAFVVGDKMVHWDGAVHWGIKFQSNYPGEETPLMATTIKESIDNAVDGYRAGRHSVSTPFCDFWLTVRDTMCSRHDVRLCGMRTELDDPRVILKEDASYRLWIDDNRDAVVASAHGIAAGLLICDGYVFKPVGEPRYEIITYGLGNNHGGTAMFIESSYNSNVAKDSYFNALQFDIACAYADRVARNRGDDKSIPVRPNCENIIEVLIPEAVLLPPTVVPDED